MSISEQALLESPGSSLNETMSANKVAIISDTIITDSIHYLLGDACVDYMDLEIKERDLKRYT
jgi:hypothetical protein